MTERTFSPWLLLLAGVLLPVAAAPLLCNELPLLARGEAPLMPALWAAGPRDFLGLALWLALLAAGFRRWRGAGLMLLLGVFAALVAPEEHVARVAEADVVLGAISPFSPASVERSADEALLARHVLGVDRHGRDLAALLLHGTRDSLLCAALVTLAATLLGTLTGACAALVRNPATLMLSSVLQALDAFPALLAVLVLQSLFFPSFALVLLWLVLFRWPAQHRLVLGEVMRLQREPWCAAARADGVSWWSLFLEELLPHMRGLLAAQAALGLAVVIAIESGLAWLGFGVPAPAVTLGALLRLGQEDLPFVTPLLLASLALISGMSLVALLSARKLQRQTREEVA